MFRLQGYFLLSVKATSERIPLQVPQRGPNGEKCHFPETSVSYTSESPDKGAVPLVSACRALTEQTLRFQICPSSFS